MRNYIQELEFILNDWEVNLELQKEEHISKVLQILAIRYIRGILVPLKKQL